MIEKLKKAFKHYRHVEYSVDTINNGRFVMKTARSGQIVIIWISEGELEIFGSLDEAIAQIGDDIDVESIVEDSGKLLEL